MLRHTDSAWHGFSEDEKILSIFSSLAIIVTLFSQLVCRASWWGGLAAEYSAKSNNIQIKIPVFLHTSTPGYFFSRHKSLNGLLFHWWQFRYCNRNLNGNLKETENPNSHLHKATNCLLPRTILENTTTVAFLYTFPAIIHCQRQSAVLGWQLSGSGTDIFQRAYCTPALWSTSLLQEEGGSTPPPFPLVWDVSFCFIILKSVELKAIVWFLPNSVSVILHFLSMLLSMKTTKNILNRTGSCSVGYPAIIRKECGVFTHFSISHSTSNTEKSIKYFQKCHIYPLVWGPHCAAAKDKRRSLTCLQE